MLTKRPAILRTLGFLHLCCFSSAVLGLSAAALGQGSQISQTPTAASDATVKAEAAVVFVEMDSSSDRVSILKKGAIVYVDLRVDQNGKSWGGVRRSAQTNRLGFVVCKIMECGVPQVTLLRNS